MNTPDCNKELHMQNSRLVLRVNEVFHDLEGDKYDEKHPEIFKKEFSRWGEMLDSCLKATDLPRVFLDFGTGTGFIPQVLASRLHERDTIHLLDISQVKLDICKKAIATAKIPGNHIYHKLGSDGNLPSALSADVITINSVLHHLPSWQEILKELGGMVTGQGLIFIGHEPNIRFGLNKTINLFIQTLRKARNGAALVKTLLKKGEPLNSYNKTAHVDTLNEKLNQILISEGVIDREMSPFEISKIVDIHSPSSSSNGSIYESKGIDLVGIKEALVGFKPLFFKTFDHLGKYGTSGFHAKIASIFLSAFYPADGYNLHAVFQKQ